MKKFIKRFGFAVAVLIAVFGINVMGVNGQGVNSNIVSITADPAVISGDTSTFYAIPNGIKRLFIVKNNSTEDFYVSKSRTALSYSYSSDPAVISGDTSITLVVPAGTTRKFTIENTFGPNSPDVLLSKKNLSHDADTRTSDKISVTNTDQSIVTSNDDFTSVSARFKFTLVNNGPDVYVPRDTSKGLLFTTTAISRLNDISLLVSSPSAASGDTRDYYVLPQGSSRNFYYIGKLQALQKGEHFAGLVKQYVYKDTKGIEKFEVSLGNLTTKPVYLITSNVIETDQTVKNADTGTSDKNIGRSIISLLFGGGKEPYLSVLTPFNNEIYNRGETVPITWDSDNISSDISIVIATPDFRTIILDKKISKDSKKYDFYIPSSTLAGNYIAVINSGNARSQSKIFRIFGGTTSSGDVKGAVQVLVPEGREMYSAGQKVQAKWISSTESDIYSIDVIDSLNTTLVQNVISDLQVNRGSDGINTVTFTIPNKPSDRWNKLRIYPTNKKELVGVSGDFKISPSDEVSAPVPAKDQRINMIDAPSRNVDVSNKTVNTPSLSTSKTLYESGERVDIKATLPENTSKVYLKVNCPTGVFFTLPGFECNKLVSLPNTFAGIKPFFVNKSANEQKVVINIFVNIDGREGSIEGFPLTLVINSQNSQNAITNPVQIQTPGEPVKKPSLLDIIFGKKDESTPTVSPSSTVSPTPTVSNSSSYKNYITILSPNGGEKIYSGSTYNISWTGNITNKTSAILVAENGTRYAIFIGMDSRTRNGTFYMPASIPVGKYRIAMQEEITNAADFSDGYFEIVAQPTYSGSATPSSSYSPSYSNSATYSSSPSYTSTATYSSSPSYTSSATYSSSPSYTSSATYSASPSYASTATYTSSPSNTSTSVSSPSSVYTSTATYTASPSSSNTVSATATYTSAPSSVYTSAPSSTSSSNTSGTYNPTPTSSTKASRNGGASYTASILEAIADWLRTI